MEIMTQSKKTISPAEVYRRGEEMYQAIKGQYEPYYKGKFLIIEIGSGRAYVDDSAIRAQEKGLAENPEGFFHLVRIGYDFWATIAH